MPKLCTFTISIEVPEVDSTDPDPTIFTIASAESYLASLEDLLAKDFYIDDSSVELEEV